MTANLLTGLGIDEFFTRTDGVGSRALLPDALESTIALGDGTGTLQTQYTYEPFGFVSQTGAASTSSYKYTGREDDGTGLMYYRARYYSPTLHRFVEEDPMTLSESFSAQQIVEARAASGEISRDDEIVLLRHSTILSNPMLQHPYLYGLNNPLRFTDPSGELVPQVVGCVIGAGTSIGLDVLSKKKISLLRAGLGCVLGSGAGYLASIANANRYLRIGFGRHGGDRVFRFAGQWVQKLTGRAHIDIWKGGPL